MRLKSTEELTKKVFCLSLPLTRKISVGYRQEGGNRQSLRTLLRALGTKNDARYNLKIIDNGTPYERPHATITSPMINPRAIPR